MRKLAHCLHTQFIKQTAILKPCMFSKDPGVEGNNWTPTGPRWVPEQLSRRGLKPTVLWDSALITPKSYPCLERKVRERPSTQTAEQAPCHKSVGVNYDYLLDSGRVWLSPNYLIVTH